MKWDSNDVKAELQGPKGLLKSIRANFLPRTEVMAELAQVEIAKSGRAFSNIDDELDALLTREFEIFLALQEEMVDRFVELADDATSEFNFPLTREIINDLKRRSSEKEEITKHLNGIVRLVIAMADSNRQSRVSRAGSSLMHHLAFLLNKNGFVYQQDYQREFVLKEGCKLDFFFPGELMYRKEPKNCCSVACQTTSNDRFRLTFAQMPEDTRNRACTAIGSNNFGKNLGPNSLTNEKLTEAKKKGVKFVVLNPAMDERLRLSEAVMSYEGWFSELKALKFFWTNEGS